MNFVTLILFVVAAVNLALALGVLAHQRAQAVNRVFAITGLSVALWTLTNALFRLSTTVASATLWAQVSYVGALFTAASFWHFSQLFPQIKNAVESRPSRSTAHPVWLAGAWIGALLLSVGAFVPGAVIRAIDLPTGRIVTGGGIYLIALFMLGSSGVAFATFYRKQQRTRGQTRAQARYVLAGSALTAAIGLGCNLLLPLWGNYSWVWLGPVGSLFFVGFSVYSIVAHHLFDIRLLIRRTVVYTLLLAGLTAVFSVLVLGLTNALQSVLGSHTPTFAINLLAALGIGLGVEPLRRWLERVTDGFLFQREQQEQALLIQLARRLGEVSLQDEVLEVLGDTIQTALQPQGGACYVLGEGEAAGEMEENMEIQSTRRWPVSGRLPGSGAWKLAPTEIRRLLKSAGQTPGAVVAWKAGTRKAAHHAALALYLPTDNPNSAERQDAPSLPSVHTVGSRRGVLLVLADKKSGQAYDASDHELLEAIGTQVTSALQRARLIVGDRQKSEFVSIAAHELLTPVTAIEGYTSLILDDAMGQVDAQAAKYLGQIQFSARRLSGLVKDLLSLSRLEAGRMTFVPQAIRVETLLEAVADQLRLSAENKGLTLTVIHNAQELPGVWADPDRVTQVLINLVVNAIKYTPQGSVTLTSEVEAVANPEATPSTGATTHAGATTQVRVQVTDSGLGMSAEAQKQLFQKFYRVVSPERENIPGTGLGLYLTKAMVEHMGGRITLHSEVGHGSSFAFTLPVASARQITIPAATTESTRLDTPPLAE